MQLARCEPDASLFPDRSTLGRGSVSCRTLRLQLRHLFVIHHGWTKPLDLRHRQQGSGLENFG